VTPVEVRVFSTAPCSNKPPKPVAGASRSAGAGFLFQAPAVAGTCQMTHTRGQFQDQDSQAPIDRNFDTTSE
ncbi:MAG: hypothetical protein KF899_03680, partial [Parvibaculum sp.]|nr:hypothetical protein [Parvibaculum sp.]